MQSKSITCLGCSKVFLRASPSQIHCSATCARNTKLAKAGSVSAFPGLPSATVGALNEIRVAADLMKRGYHAFRALSPACPCDLIALKDNVCIRIEVKTAYYNRSGGISTSPTRYNIFDVLARVLPDVITYEPALPEP